MSDHEDPSSNQESQDNKTTGIVADDYGQPRSEKPKQSPLRTIALVLILASSSFLNVGGNPKARKHYMIIFQH